MRVMKAMGKGGPTMVTMASGRDPVAGEGQTIVDVKAAAVNRADLLQLAGKYEPPPGESDVLGLEAAGIDRETGARVCFLLGSGGMAERVAVDKRRLLPLPDNLDFVQGAAIPEVWLTAYTNLFDEAALKKGESVLIHAAASGVGTAAIQLAKRAGAKVIGTVRTEAKVRRVLELGADLCLNTTTTHAHASAIGHPVDVILDVLGADALDENMGALAIGGRLVIIALMQGAKGPIDLRTLLSRRLTLKGTTLRARSGEEKAALTQRFARDVWPAFASGDLKPIVDSVFPMREAEKALDKLAKNENVGKVVLTW